MTTNPPGLLNTFETLCQKATVILTSEGIIYESAVLEKKIKPYFCPP